MPEKRENALVVPDIEINRGGRPEAEVDYDLLFMLANRRMTQEEACPFLKISRTTFQKKLKEEERFREVWEAGRAVAAMSIRDLMWRHASGSGPAAVEATKQIARHFLGETDKSVIEHANKDGKPLEVKVAEPTAVMGIDLATASPDVLAALEVIAEAAAKRAADEAIDITDVATEA